MSIPIIKSANSVGFVVDGQPYQADASHPNYQALLDELKKPNPDTTKCIGYTQPIVAIRESVAAAQAAEPDYLPAGKVSVTLNEIRYDGEIVHGVLVERILSMLAEGFDIMPMVRFLENLYLNPALWVRDELYTWLERSTLPITEDGYFLAYKKVNADFTSIYDNTTRNDPGTVVTMDRTKVNADRALTCSSGLHFCSKDYLPGFGVREGATIVLVKVSPADVVSVPANETAKGRTWKYEVLQVVEDDPQTKVWPSVVAKDGSEFEDEDDFDNYNDDDDYTSDWDSSDWDDDIDYDNTNDSLVIGSVLAKSLFAAGNEIGLTERSARLSWASNVLNGDLDSYEDLTIGEAQTLLEAAQAQKAQDDTEAEADANAELGRAQVAAREAEIAKINSYGIISLRRNASQAGLAGAWNGKGAAELRAYLISLVK